MLGVHNVTKKFGVQLVVRPDEYLHCIERNLWGGTTLSGVTGVAENCQIDDVAKSATRPETSEAPGPGVKKIPPVGLNNPST